ncbi:MAG: hypothetical protein JW976_08860 [Syntrophaceae bacterium]|nr:hypothetical protein [Syntrophaceae bacterium]
MSRAKVGDILVCEACGLKVIVEEECGCATIDIICCEEAMKNLGPAKPKKVQAVAGPKKKKALKKVKRMSKKKRATKKAKVVKKKKVKKTIKKSAKKASKKAAKKRKK